jgi:hypothetical protein
VLARTTHDNRNSERYTRISAVLTIGAAPAFRTSGLFDDPLIIVSELAANAIATGCKRQTLVTAQLITAPGPSCQAGVRNIPTSTVQGSSFAPLGPRSGPSSVERCIRGSQLPPKQAGSGM